MRVGLNLTFLGEHAGGVGRYAIELAGALAAHPDVELEVVGSRDLPTDVRRLPWAREVRWTILPISGRQPRAHLAAQFSVLPALAMARRWDVLHSPGNAGPILIPGVASVITMHDVIWLHAADDWGSPGAVRAMRRIAVPTARRAAQVVAVSHAAAAELVEYLDLDPARITVAPHGVTGPEAGTSVTSEVELRRRFDLGEGPVVLCVAQKRPYKNQEALVRSLAMLGDPSVRLVLPGAPTEYEKQLRALAASAGVSAQVRCPAWVNEPDLEGLYALAHCFVLPSRMEGFGLPVLEAMARGLPVACSAIPSLVEVAGEAAVFFDPSDDSAISAALGLLLRDHSRCADLARRGRARASLFTWAGTAEATVSAYRRARIC